MQQCHYCKEEFPIAEMTKHQAYDAVFYLCASCQAENDRQERLAYELEAQQDWEQRQFEEGNVYQDTDGTWRTEGSYWPPDHETL